jgi:EAL domain-containing protein (putative c-di-GMP-specific phosphodiesterase class I)
MAARAEQFGCQFAQGNAFSPPVDADPATMFLPVLPETRFE